MSRRVPIRLARLLAVVGACLVPAATAQAAAPLNDMPSGAQDVSGLVGWTSLSNFGDIVVQASDWGDATTGPEDADPLPSCTSAIGFRSMWYTLKVPEAAVLRVRVISTDLARYQPVVTILDPSNDEVACGLAAIGKAGSAATATAYVTPAPDGPSTYRIRVAQVTNNTPSGGLPTLTVSFAARDVTAPHIRVTYETAPPRKQTTYDAGATPNSLGTTDLASQVNPGTAQWEFHDVRADKRPTVQVRRGLTVRYSWLTPGAHEVVFRVADFAGNENLYTFTTLVQDVVRPDVKFSLRPPVPGARRLQITVNASESVRVRLLVTQVGRSGPLLKGTVSLWGEKVHSRSIRLRGAVGEGLLVISGVARDLAGNTTALPQCVVDPVTGQGRCTSP